MANKENARREMTKFFAKGAEASYFRGETIFTPYSFAQSVYLIKSGFVKVVAPNADGQQSLLCILGPGDIFPFPGGFGVYKVEAFYVAMSQLKVRRMSSELLLHVVEHNSMMSMAIMLQIYDLLSLYSNRVYTLTLKSQRQRLASFLIILNGRFGISQGSDIILNIPLTHAEITASISSTRESVSRVIGVFIKENIIEQRNRLIIIKNLSALQAILQIT